MKYLAVLVPLLLAFTASAQSVRDIRPHNLPAPFDEVGALQPFDFHNVLRLSAYCDGSIVTDHGACIDEWMADARAQGRHMLADRGRYYSADTHSLVSGDYIKCSDAEFVMTNPQASALFRVEERARQRDIYVGHCVFDLNANTRHFGGVIASGTRAPDDSGIHVRHMTVENNHFYDSSRPGQLDDDRHTAQRQYVLILQAENILIRNNRLESGGRIKAGRPGRKMAIVENVIHGVNDNGITVVDTDRLEIHGASEDIFIHKNEIHGALTAPIFIGGDGGVNTGPTLRTARITVTENYIVNSTGHCILLQLPIDSEEIHVGRNVCVYQTPITHRFPTAINVVNRSDVPVTLVDNLVVNESGAPPNQDIVAYRVSDGPACMIDNRAYGVPITAHRFHTSAGWVAMQLGEMEGQKRVDADVVVTDDISDCYISPLADGVLPERWLAR